MSWMGRKYPRSLKYLSSRFGQRSDAQLSGKMRTGTFFFFKETYLQHEKTLLVYFWRPTTTKLFRNRKVNLLLRKPKVLLVLFHAQAISDNKTFLGSAPWFHIKLLMNIDCFASAASPWSWTILVPRKRKTFLSNQLRSISSSVELCDVEASNGISFVFLFNQKLPSLQIF